MKRVMGQSATKQKAQRGSGTLFPRALLVGAPLPFANCNVDSEGPEDVDTFGLSNPLE